MAQVTSLDSYPLLKVQLINDLRGVTLKEIPGSNLPSLQEVLVRRFRNGEPWKPVEGQIVILRNALMGIRLTDSLKTKGISLSEMPPSNLGIIQDVYVDDRKLPVAFRSKPEEGEYFTDLTSDFRSVNWIPASLIGTVVGGNLIIDKELLTELSFPIGSANFERDISSRNRSLLELFNHPNFWGRLGILTSEIVFPDRMLAATMEKRFRQFQLRCYQEFFEASEQIDLAKLTPGQTFIHSFNPGDLLQLGFSIFRGEAKASDPNAPRVFIIARIDAGRDDGYIRPFTNLGAESEINTRNQFQGRVFSGVDAMLREWNKMLNDMRRVDYSLRSVMLSHLGLNLTIKLPEGVTLIN
jgi:hypothetical protein